VKRRLRRAVADDMRRRTKRALGPALMAAEAEQIAFDRTGLSALRAALVKYREACGGGAS